MSFFAHVGDYISSAVAEASGVSLTSGVHANITSISVTPGDWDISSVVCLRTGAGVTTTQNIGSVNTTSATFPGGNSNQVATMPVGITAESLCAIALPTFRVSVTVATTYYLIGYSAFSGGAATCVAWGRIYARRAK